MQDQRNFLPYDADRIPTDDFGGLRSDSVDKISPPPVVEAPLSARHRGSKSDAAGPGGMMIPPMMGAGMGSAGGSGSVSATAAGMRASTVGGVLPAGAGAPGGMSSAAGSMPAATPGPSNSGFGSGTGSFGAPAPGGWSTSAAPVPPSSAGLPTGTHAADGADVNSSTPATPPSSPGGDPHGAENGRLNAHGIDPTDPNHHYDPTDPQPPGGGYHPAPPGYPYRGGSGTVAPARLVSMPGLLDVQPEQLDDAAARWNGLSDRMTSIGNRLNAAVARAGDFGLVIHPQPAYVQAHAIAQARAGGSAADFSDTSGRLVRTSVDYRETEAANVLASNKIGFRS